MSLRDVRSDPAVLAAGDVVHVPAAPPRTFEGLLTRRDHEIVLELPLPLLRLTLVRPGYVGYADVETRTVVDGFDEGFIPDPATRMRCARRSRNSSATTGCPSTV